MRRGVEVALDELVNIGAVTRIKPVRGETPGGEVLTPLGKHLLKLGVDCRIGKFLIYSCILKCLGKGLAIASLLSVGKSVFIDGDGGEGKFARRKVRRKLRGQY